MLNPPPPIIDHIDYLYHSLMHICACIYTYSPASCLGHPHLSAPLNSNSRLDLRILAWLGKVAVHDTDIMCMFMQIYANKLEVV